jgi:hypothetical protein
MSTSLSVATNFSLTINAVIGLPESNTFSPQYQYHVGFSRLDEMSVRPESNVQRQVLQTSQHTMLNCCRGSIIMATHKDTYQLAE